jgi:hypothetical protein
VRIPVWVLLLSLLFATAGCNRDARDYEKAQQANTIEAYEDFVQKHPDSKFVEPAKAQAEELLLKSVESKNTLADYRSFLKKYPRSKHASEVAARMRQLVPLKGQASTNLRGWSSEGKLLVVVTVPLPNRPSVALDKYELRADGKPLGQCIGIVPPEKFAGGVTGMINQERDNTPLPVAGLQPARTVRSAVAMNDVNVMGFFYSLSVTDGLIVGQKLTMTSAGAGSFVLADPSITYLLLGNGYHFSSELRQTKQNGFRVPLKEKMSLLFVVAPPVAPVVELVSDDGVSTDAAIEMQ